MEYSQLSNDIKVSKLQFGCSRLGKAVKEDTTKIATSILNQAWDSGINFYDTAANYVYGQSEELLGKFAKDKRSEIIIATKGGTMISKKASFARYFKPIYNIVRPIVHGSKALKKHKKRYNFEYDYLRSTLDDSLGRLDTDYVDVYLLHSPTSEVIAKEETSDFFSQLKKTGKVRLTGHSVDNMDRLDAVKSVDNIDVLQVPFNYYLYNEEDRIKIEKIKSKGVKVIMRAPFQRGLLTSYDQMKTGRKTGSKDQRAKSIKDSLKEKLQINETELALWFIKDLGLADSLLFSSFTSKHLAENIKTFLADIDPEFSWKSLI